MTTLIATPAVQPTFTPYRFSVAAFQRMVALGLFDEERVELLEGIVVTKMPHNAPHDCSVQAVNELISPMLPRGWCIRIQSAITLSHSQPEPDGCVARGDRSHYRLQRPGPRDIGLLIEVSDSTLDNDRYKCEIYARANIHVYWIVNLGDRQIEVYTRPSGSQYTQQDIYTTGMTVPFVLDGIPVGQLVVDDLLP